MEIAVEQLTRTFGAVRANDAVTLRFGAGQIHGVLGENGAGKSTLMKMLAGYLTPDSGAILVDGRKVQMRGPGDALRAGIGMVHQEPLDIPAFTALENVLCAAPRGVFRSPRDAAQRLTALAAQLGFGIDPQSPLATLTVGLRQQLEILRLLLCGAQILILDEPTTGITAAQARALFDALRRLRTQGRTVLFVSHKLDEVAALCDTVSVLRAGQVVGDGLRQMPQPQQALIELMFGSAAADASVPQPAEQFDRVTWRLNAVSAQSGGMVLNDLTRSFAAGRVIGLAGLEGSGQQVLLRLLAGQVAPMHGHVLVDEHDLSGRGQQAFRRAGIEFLPADRLKEGVVGALTIVEHFALLQPPSLLVDYRAAEAAARAAVAEYQIKGTPASPLTALSGGNQQRAMLSMVPDQVRGILAEQPTRGLDVASARAIWTRLLARRDAGATIVFATADLDEILQYSDEVIICFSGRLSPLIPRSELDANRLAELIGGVGFDELETAHAAT